MRRFQVNLFHTYALSISVPVSRCLSPSLSLSLYLFADTHTGVQMHSYAARRHTFAYEYNSIIGTEGGKNKGKRERGGSCVLCALDRIFIREYHLTQIRI